MFYKVLLHDITVPPKIEIVCPSIDFKQVWSNFNAPYIDPDVRNTFWKLCHDVIYVNYYLFHRRISKVNTCPLCNKIETVSHLFLECSVFSPLNKIVLFFLRKVTRNKITFSEKTFRFFELPALSKLEKQICLIILSESRHIIWINRNFAKHEAKNITVDRPT